MELDATKQTNRRPLDALPLLDAIEVVQYDGYFEKPTPAFAGQNIFAVLGQGVSNDPQMFVDPMFILPVVARAVQQLQDKIEQLEATITSLQSSTQ